MSKPQPNDSNPHPSEGPNTNPNLAADPNRNEVSV